MQPNIIERVWRQDKMVNVDVLNGFVFTDEEEAHRFIISGKNVNTPVDISGTITANFKNADGVLVPLTGTIEDGKAVVVLSRECYAVEGPFSLMIFADTVCVYAAIANVINSSGEVIVYPTASIPSVQELIEEVRDVIASIPQDYSALNQSVQDLKSAIDEQREVIYKKTSNMLDFGIVGGMWLQGYPGGAEPYVCHTVYIPVAVGEKYYGVIDKAKYEESFNYPIMQLLLRAYDSNDEMVGNSVNLSTNGSQSTGSYTVPSGVVKVSVILTSTSWGNTVTPTMLNNVDTAFAYFGKENVSHEDIHANYKEYPAYNDSQIQSMRVDVTELRSSERLTQKLAKQIDVSQFTLYGPKSTDFVVEKVQTWQPSTYLQLDGSVMPGVRYYFNIDSFHTFTTMIASIVFKNASGENVYSRSITSSDLNNDGSLSFLHTAEANATTFTFTVYGIGNYSTAPAIGDVGYIRGVSVTAGQAQLETIFKNTLLDFASSQGTGDIYSTLDQAGRQYPNGIIYGPKSVRYVPKKTNERWVTDSYATITAPAQEGQVVYCGCLSRFATGQNVAVLVFYNSSDESILTRTLPMGNYLENPAGGFLFSWTAPANTASIMFEVYGISNPASGAEAIVGNEYYISNAFVYIGDIDFTDNKHIPTSWINSIQNIETDIGNGFCFGVQTDTHHYIGQHFAVGWNMNEYTHYVSMDFICNLGDIIQGYGNQFIDSPERTRKSYTDITKRYTDGVGCPVLFAVGNHDSNKMHHDAYGSAEFTNKELFGRLIKYGLRTSPKSVSDGESLYYYTDFDRVRVITVNTGDGDTAGAFIISNKQKEWFINEALNTDKQVLVLSHVPLVAGITENYDPSYAEIIDALAAFKANGGVVIGCFSGHMHYQTTATEDGILQVVFTESFTYEETAEIVVVDLDNHSIKTYGFGAAQNRNFIY